MFNPLACVSPRLHRRGEEEEFEEEFEASPCSTTSSTPRSCSPTTKTKTTTTTTTTSSGGKKGLNKRKKNPYSTCGLDKFSTLLADLEERKRKIYAQVDDDKAPYVGFIRSKSGDWLPIVVRLGNHDNHTSTTTITPTHEHNKRNYDHKAVALTKNQPIIGVCGAGGKDKSLQGRGSTQNNPTPAPPIKNNKCSSSSSKASSPPKLVQLQQQQQQQHRQQQQEHRKQATLATASANSSSCTDTDGRTAAASNNKKKKSSDNSMGMMRWGRPAEYLPLVVVLSLVCLMMFGRSVAILLTSACWYLIPTIKTTQPTTTTAPINPNPKRSSAPSTSPSPSSSFVKKKIKKKEHTTRLSSQENNNHIMPSSNMPN